MMEDSDAEEYAKALRVARDSIATVIARMITRSGSTALVPPLARALEQLDPAIEILEDVEPNEIHPPIDDSPRD